MYKKIYRKRTYPFLLQIDVSALTRFSWRSVSALTGFSRKEKRRAPSEGICAVAPSDLFQSHLTLDLLLFNHLCKHSVFPLREKMDFRLPSSVTVFLVVVTKIQ